MRQAVAFGCLFALGFAGGAGSVVAALQLQPAPVAALPAPASPALAARATLQATTALSGLATPEVQASPATPAVLRDDHLPPPSGGARQALQARAAKAAAAPPAVAAKAADAPRPVVVESGDTLMQILLANGIEATDAHAAIAALQDVYDPRTLRTGQELLITPAPSAGPRRLSELTFSVGPLQAIEVLRDGEGTFQSRKVERPRRRMLVHSDTVIRDSLYLAASRAAVPLPVTAELIKLFSWDVDFQRDVHAGDSMDVLYEQVVVQDAEGAVVPGDILFARLALSGRQITAYRFKQSNGTVAYFDRSGRSLKKSLLRTPIDGGRISSTFGMRRHPILGYSRMHKGVDFAAPPGTPIFAAGSGRIEAAGWNGGYGNYVRIAHNGTYGTAYAHMSQIAQGVRVGAEVRQGQVIGYVGTTGRSTGPHLHYEIIRHGEQVNPLRVRQAALDQLSGEELARFEQEVERIDGLRARSRTAETRLAARIE